MPNHYKALVSVLAIALCTTVFYFDSGSGIARWVALALGPMMAGAIWILPEAKAKEIRREAATRR